MDLEVLRRTAAQIAAAAMYELYPEVELLGGHQTATGFTYDFIFPHPIHSHIIEEKMKQIVREKRPIRTLEMVPFSARELLKANGHFARAEAIEGEELVEVIQMGNFHDLSPGPHLKNTAELAAFKIDVASLGDNQARITGWCHFSKDELKQFLKRLENYTEPKKLGEAMGLWKKEVWLKKGLKLKEKLIEFLKKEWFEGAFEISGPAEESRLKIHRSFKKEKVAEVWSLSYQETYLQISFFGQINSCLHLIAKTLTILGFDHSISHEGAATQFVVVDGIGRKQVLVQMEKEGNDCTVFACVERILDQMLEKNLWVVLENQ